MRGIVRDSIAIITGSVIHPLHLHHQAHNPRLIAQPTCQIRLEWVTVWSVGVSEIKRPADSGEYTLVQR